MPTKEEYIDFCDLSGRVEMTLKEIQDTGKADSTIIGDLLKLIELDVPMERSVLNIGFFADICIAMVDRTKMANITDEEKQKLKSYLQKLKKRSNHPDFYTYSCLYYHFKLGGSPLRISVSRNGNKSDIEFRTVDGSPIYVISELYFGLTDVYRICIFGELYEVYKTLIESLDDLKICFTCRYKGKKYLFGFVKNGIQSDSTDRITCKRHFDVYRIYQKGKQYGKEKQKQEQPQKQQKPD